MKIRCSAFINISLAILVFYLVSTFKERNLLQTNNAPAPYFNLPLLNQPTERISIAQFKGKTTTVYFLRAMVHNLSLQHAESRSCTREF
jgi:cytochrome oxidase Cu insertion factor (SCO1/SenC/PrrC family)